MVHSGDDKAEMDGTVVSDDGELWRVEALNPMFRLARYKPGKHLSALSNFKF